VMVATQMYNLILCQMKIYSCKIIRFSCKKLKLTSLS